MNNKKGFTLIELLAIIVILAVIMAIAIPQLLNVVNGSKDSAWKDNVKMISKSIELNTQLFDPETGNYAYTIDGLCKNPSKVNEISKSSDTTVTCSNKVFTISGTGQFDGKKATIDCRNGNFKITFMNGSSNNEGGSNTVTKLEPGLYDSEDNLLVSWDSLVNDYGFDVEAGQSKSTIASIMNDHSELANGSKLIIGNVSKIGVAVLSNSNLAYVKISNTVSSIDTAAFYNCKNLEHVEFENDSILETIKDNVFNGSGLKSIEIPKSVTTIGNNAFTSCTNLSSVTFEKNSKLKSIGNIIFYDDTKLTNIELPNSLESIGANVFTNTSIVNLKIPGSVKEIASSAFVGMPELVTVEIGAKGPADMYGSLLTTLSGPIFSGDKKLTNVFLPESLTKITGPVFANTNIETISIPPNVTEIGDKVFESSNLKSVSFKRAYSLTTIGNYAFYSTKLTSVELPAKLTTIGQYAFGYCDNLNSVSVVENSKLNTINSKAFYRTPWLTKQKELANDGPVYLNGVEVK